MSIELAGYLRADGRWGARNHILVLPSVVCSGLAAERIAQMTDTIHVVHQHGCGQVGDDVEHTERAFFGMATNPNVGGTVVVSLGCETIQGKRLADRIARHGQRLKFTGIQLSGGTDKAVDAGCEAVAALNVVVEQDTRRPMPPSGLLIGVDCDDEHGVQIAQALASIAESAGAGMVLAAAGDKPTWSSGPLAQAATVAYGDSAPAGRISIVEEAGRGSEQHVALAAAGAQVLIALRGRGRPPVGFAICPVIAAAGDTRTYTALVDDFDVDGSGEPDTVARSVWNRTLEVFGGRETASERRGARDFSLGRLARNM